MLYNSPGSDTVCVCVLMYSCRCVYRCKYRCVLLVWIGVNVLCVYCVFRIMLGELLCVCVVYRGIGTCCCVLLCLQVYVEV